MYIQEKICSQTPYVIKQVRIEICTLKKVPPQAGQQLEVESLACVQSQFFVPQTPYQDFFPLTFLVTSELQAYQMDNNFNIKFRTQHASSFIINTYCCYFLMYFLKKF